MRIQFNKVIELATEKLIALGYKPTFPFEGQLDCNVNGIGFAIYPDDGERVFGYGCIFEPRETQYEDGFLDLLKERYNGDYAPFDHLYTCEDGYIHLEGESDTYTDELIDEIVHALSDECKIASLIKSKSYVWEEK